MTLLALHQWQPELTLLGLDRMPVPPDVLNRTQGLADCCSSPEPKQCTGPSFLSVTTVMGCRQQAQAAADFVGSITSEP